jgi:hypothetical protein
MYGIIRSGPVSFQISSRQYTGRSVGLGSQIIHKAFVFPLCPCDVPYSRTMWFAWIVATEEKRYAGILADSTA